MYCTQLHLCHKVIKKKVYSFYLRALSFKLYLDCVKDGIYFGRESHLLC